MLFSFKINCCILFLFLLTFVRASAQNTSFTFPKGPFRFAGKNELNPLSEKKYLVISFISPDCPLCQKYSSTINELITTFSSDSIDFVGIVPGKYHTEKKVLQYIKEFTVKQPLLLDQQLRWVKALKATITPEVFLINTTSGQIIYSGAIDNWAIDVSKKRPQPTIFYLKEGLNSIVNQTIPKINHSPAIGCFIE